MPPTTKTRIIAFQKGLNWLLAALLPPILVGTALTLSTFNASFKHATPEMPDAGTEGGQPPASVPVDPEALQVGILLSTDGATETLEALGPAEILSFGGPTQLRPIQADRTSKRLLALTGNVGIWPDYTLADWEGLNPRPKIDVLILPSHTRALSQSAVEWLRAHASEFPRILAPSEGARHAAEAGLLEGGQAATHFLSLGTLSGRYPDVRWRSGERFVRWKDVITTGGVSAALDGALEMLRDLRGEDAADSAAQILGLTELERVETPRELSSADKARLVLAAAFDWYTPTIAVLLSDNVSELGLASALEPFPRTLANYATTVSERRRFYRTRHGLQLVASEAVFYGAYYPDLLIVPPGSKPWGQEPTGVVNWASTRSSTQIHDHAQGPPGKELDAELSLVTRWEGPEWALLVAKLIEKPWTEDLADETGFFVSTLPYLSKVLLLALGGMGGLWLFRRRSSKLKRK